MNEKIKFDNILILLFFISFLIINILGYIFDIIASVRKESTYIISYVPIIISLLIAYLFYLLYKLKCK